jgi:hypothetical protein
MQQILITKQIQPTNNDNEKDPRIDQHNNNANEQNKYDNNNNKKNLISKFQI